VEEYRSGAHPPTVLSSIIQNHDYSQTEDDELYDQLVADLEARDVHPDCISLHDDYIRNWLGDIALDGNLDKAGRGSRGTDPNAPDLAANIPSASSRFTSAVHHCVTSEDEIVIERQGMPDAESPDSADSSSQAGSSLVHPWDIHTVAPPDQPHPEHAQQILGTLLEDDPYLPYDPAAALIKFQRAYQRLDYTQRGYLTRSEVLKASHEAMKYVGIVADKIYSMDLPVVISASDTNQDGQYDESKFVAVMHHAVQLAFEAKREQLAETLSRCGGKARASLRQQRKLQLPTDPDGQEIRRLHANSRKYILPFGWSENPPGSALRFHDHISEGDWQVLPDLQSETFSIMAVDAAWSVEVIDNLQAKWLPTVPKALRGNFLEDFNAARSAALKYTEFEKSGCPFELSDLDDFATSYHIIQEGKRDTLPDHYHDIAHNLEKARAYSYKTLGMILAFAQLLDEALPFEPTIQRFPDLNSVWRKSQASVASRLIRESSQKWPAVVQSMSMCRQVAIHELHNQALALAQDNVRHKFADIELEGSLQRISIFDFKPLLKPKWTFISRYWQRPFLTPS
jgi:hypothetical protein